jgi:hypothetical protein
LDPMGKCSNAFFSETTNMIKVKLYMNVHWMVLYKLYVFYSDMKFKMWISDQQTIHRFSTGPPNDHSWAVWFQLSKWFQRRSILKHFPVLIGNPTWLPGPIMCSDWSKFKKSSC